MTSLKLGAQTCSNRDRVSTYPYLDSETTVSVACLTKKLSSRFSGIGPQALRIRSKQIFARTLIRCTSPGDLDYSYGVSWVLPVWSDSNPFAMPS